MNTKYEIISPAAYIQQNISKARIAHNINIHRKNSQRIFRATKQFTVELFVGPAEIAEIARCV